MTWTFCLELCFSSNGGGGKGKKFNFEKPLIGVILYLAVYCHNVWWRLTENFLCRHSPDSPDSPDFWFIVIMCGGDWPKIFWKAEAQLHTECRHSPDSPDSPDFSGTPDSPDSLKKWYDNWRVVQKSGSVIRKIKNGYPAIIKSKKTVVEYTVIT